MPTYEYRCKTCGINFEEFQHMNDAALAHCPVEVCPLEEGKKGTGIVERRISAGTGLVFKGSGFYITDYKGTGQSPSTSSGSSKKSEGDSTSSSAPAAPAPGASPAPSKSESKKE
jgi:putative FmdB family regulatory protein